jgi:hypothetical protein
MVGNSSLIKVMEELPIRPQPIHLVAAERLLLPFPLRSWQRAIFCGPNVGVLEGLDPPFPFILWSTEVEIDLRVCLSLLYSNRTITIATSGVMNRIFAIDPL